ncbi:DsrE family protein [Christiangramia sp. SM2212]|uniref:DsrE family protein n=1 Tax=Christiangramia sediminicola TaxID=3073267 RepID=A0ABU1ER46_9FLAO|nr:DsrE family protein [Christiangramia sp. SM2212]MDR5590862.1 DsrE family protein [Christiangramia sp. SM2212]
MKKMIFAFLIMLTCQVNSQEAEPGNVITSYGKTFDVKSPEFKTDTTSVLKVVFDVDRPFKASEPNALIETAARFLNMHEKAGVNPRNMKVALVIHGKAVKDVLKDEYYQDTYTEETSNPNSGLIKELANNGVEIILCGQSAAFYKVTREKAMDEVKYSLSAMTALVQLQNDGYQLIKF